MILPAFVRSLYRRDPLTALIVLFGSVEVAIGGMARSWSLLSFGVIVMAIAIALRQKKAKKSPVSQLRKPRPRAYLSPVASPQPLPELMQKN